MPRNKSQIPTNRQNNRSAILSQTTTETEARERSGIGQQNNDTKAERALSHGKGELVEPINREMYPPPAQKFPWDKVGVYIAVILPAIAFIWYLAYQDSTIKNLTDDSKDLKRRAEESTHFTIESGIRLTNVEQRILSVEQHERSRNQSNEATIPTYRNNGKGNRTP